MEWRSWDLGPQVQVEVLVLNRRKGISLILTVGKEEEASIDAGTFRGMPGS